MRKTLEAACICCGGDIVVEYDSEMTKYFAEARLKHWLDAPRQLEMEDL